MKSKEKVLIMSMVVIMLTVIVGGMSYAYFTATVTGPSSANIIKTGTMALDLTDGPEITANNTLYGEQQ